MPPTYTYTDYLRLARDQIHMARTARERGAPRLARWYLSWASWYRRYAWLTKEQ